MRASLKRVRGLSESQWVEFRRRTNRPWVDLAEQVGCLRSPFDNLSVLQNGFSSENYFVVARAEGGDPEARSLRSKICQAERYWRLSNGEFPQNFEEELLDYMDRNADELDGLRRSHSPWDFAIENCDSAMDLATPRLGADEIFASRVFAIIESFGFSPSRARSGKTAWSCWRTYDETRIVLEVDKGTHGLDYAASWTLPDFDLGWPIALPFLYSGGSFRASKAHPFALQLERFFTSYAAVMPFVWEAICHSIRAGNGYLSENP